MKFFKFFILSLVLVSFIITPVLAKKADQIFRRRAEWVKLTKLSKKQMAGQTLDHPYQISPEKLVPMLQSLNMNKRNAFKKDKIKTSEVFSLEEARRFAPHLSKALNQAASNQIVNMSVIHKRPHYIVRNDHVSILNVFKTKDGLHIHIPKLFAKISGDYKQMSKIQKSIKNAKSLRIGLMANEGQIILPTGDELVLDTDFDFSKNIAQKSESLLNNPNLSSEPAHSLSPKNRLQKLNELKKTGLITESEYKKKKRAILKQL